MTPIIVSVIAMSVVLAVMIFRLAHGVNALRRDMARDFAARIEGLFVGLARRDPTDARS